MNVKLLEADAQHMSESEIISLLAESDRNMARVFEDAIRVMLKVGTIQLRDLPECAREILEARTKLRIMLDERRGHL
ncbi:MAG: hypothetical protein HXX11_09160 [Desulfuromonadales bacterium]|nr:hypothetical protein [Desulfuromonadales bacterium]